MGQRDINRDYLTQHFFVSWHRLHQIKKKDCLCTNIIPIFVSPEGFLIMHLYYDFPLEGFSVYRVDNSASRSSWVCKSKLTREITVWRRVKNGCSDTMSKYWRSRMQGQQVGSRTDSMTNRRAHSRVFCYLSGLGNLSIKTCQITPNESELLNTGVIYLKFTHLSLWFFFKSMTWKSILHPTAFPLLRRL